MNIILVGNELVEKQKQLTKVGASEDGWCLYYIDENSEKWILEYPNSEYHGGGTAQLRSIEKFPWE